MSKSPFVDIIGAPMGLGGKRAGARLGPAALRVAQIESQLRDLGIKVEDLGDVIPGVRDQHEKAGEGIRHFDAVLEELTLLRKQIAASLKNDHVPLVLGGDHSMAIASISACLERYGTELGVIWIDAHADLNTPDTSPSLNLHGMPLGLLCGYDDSGTNSNTQKQWKTLQYAMIPEQKLDLKNCLWFGLRELDPAETERIVTYARKQAITMHDVDKFGVSHLVGQVFDTLRKSGVKKVWVSFDVDVLDPFIAPGVGTGVRGGLTYREAHFFAESLADHVWYSHDFDLAGLEICEVNPLLDRTNETALIAAEWTLSLFGKRILPY